MQMRGSSGGEAQRLKPGNDGFPIGISLEPRGPHFQVQTVCFLGWCSNYPFFFGGGGAIYLRAISDMMIVFPWKEFGDIIHEITTDRRNQYDENGFRVWSFFRKC